MCSFSSPSQWPHRSQGEGGKYDRCGVNACIALHTNFSINLASKVNFHCSLFLRIEFRMPGIQSALPFVVARESYTWTNLAVYSVGAASVTFLVGRTLRLISYARPQTLKFVNLFLNSRILSGFPQLLYFILKELCTFFSQCYAVLFWY